MAKFLSDEEVSDLVYKDIKWSRDFRQDRRDTWERMYALYRNYLDQATYPWEANLAIPTAFSITEVQTAFLIDMIFESGDFVEVMGKTSEGQASARAVKEMLSYHFRHSFQTYEEMEKFIRQLLMYGTSVFKVFWDYRPGWKTRIVPEYVNNELKKYKSVLSAEVLENKPNGYSVDLFNFGIDPNAADVRSARFAFEEMWIDSMTLMEKQQAGIFKNVDKHLGSSTSVNEGLQRRMDKIDIVPNQNSPEVEREKVHIVDYWGYIPKGWKDGKLSTQAKTQLYHVVLALTSSYGTGDGLPTVLLAEPSPFHHNRIPFIDAGLNRCVGEFYGMGDLEYCESLFLEERDLRNIQLDNMTRTMNNMWGVLRGSGIDEGELVHRPGGIVHYDIPEALQSLQTQPIDPGAFKTQEDIRRDIEMVTGVNDFVMGQYRSSTGFNDTATGISLIQQVALKRMGHKGQIVQRSIRDIAQMTFSLVAQYQPWGTSVRILDKESATAFRFIDISPQALSKEYDFHIVNAPSLGSKPLRQNQLIQVLQLLIQMQQHGGEAPDLKRFTKRLLEEMEIPNPSEFFGFQDFNQPLNPDLGQPAAQQELFSPEEENRLMVEQHQMLYPKLEENHQHHMIVHGEIYDQTNDQQARQIIEEHVEMHRQLAAQAKELLATSLQTQMASEQVQNQMAQSDLLSGGTQKSPTGAGGQEDVMRGMGNLMGGNA